MPIETSRRFQFSIGDAPQGEDNSAERVAAEVSILYWRCNSKQPNPREHHSDQGFNSLLEMHFATRVEICVGGGSARFNSLLEMRLDKYGIKHQFAEFQFSIGDAGHRRSR